MNPLQQQIEAEYLPEEKKFDYDMDRQDILSHEEISSFNEALSICKQSLPKIIELIEKDTRETIVREVKQLRHEIQQDKMPLGNEQWKEGHTKCLEEVLELLTPHSLI